VDETRAFSAEPQRLQHGVQVLAGSGAALHGQPGRLVENDDSVVPVENP